MPHLKLIGIGCHIGSQLTGIEPFLESDDCLLEIADDINQAGIRITTYQYRWWFRYSISK